ncbi:helix-hairpin-helix domain-containing protein [bacterium]|nr:helix-hairpin-helix domain-containing protein [bacterium]MBU1990299.1 helix-hairpin-helix domain-containing protein [bacterium]
MRLLTIMACGISMLFGAVDINTADMTELATLKGIGNKKAAKIIKYRETHCFKNVEELAKVKGIKKKVLKKNKGNLTASECKVK